MIRLNYNTYILRKITKTSSENIIIENNQKLSKLINTLNAKYGRNFINNLIDLKSGRLKLIVLVNGKSVDDLKYIINNNDKLNIISLTTGG